MKTKGNAFFKALTCDLALHTAISAVGTTDGDVRGLEWAAKGAISICKVRCALA